MNKYPIKYTYMEVENNMSSSYIAVPCYLIKKLIDNEYSVVPMYNSSDMRHFKRTEPKFYTKIVEDDVTEYYPTSNCTNAIKVNFISKTFFGARQYTDSLNLSLYKQGHYNSPEHRDHVLKMNRLLEQIIIRNECNNNTKTIVFKPTKFVKKEQIEKTSNKNSIKSDFSDFEKIKTLNVIVGKEK